MMKQKLALLLTALLLLTGCSSGGSGDTADGQDDGELETIDVVLDWYPNAVHAFLYEAEEKYGRAQGTLIFKKMSFFVAP